MRKLLSAAVLLALATTAIAQDVAKKVKIDDVAWREHPLLKGAQTATLVGDPTKESIAVVRIKFPPNFRIAPHSHPYGEVLTVISGTFGFGEGETLDAGKVEQFKAGSVIAIPAKQPHYVLVGGEETVVQFQFTGPAGISFINPADDPRKK
jgi:quercetin dioxygenase-like cupin family protein